MNSILAIVEVLDDISQHAKEKSVSIQDIVKYTELGKGTLNKAIVCSKTFGLLEETSDGFKLTNLGKQLASLDDKQCSNLIGKTLLDFKPFVYFCSKLASGDSVERAIKKMIQIFDIEGAPKEIAYTFKSLGTFSELLNKDGTLNHSVIPREDIISDMAFEFKDSLKSEVEAKIFLIDRLSSDVYNFLPKDSVNNLIQSLVKIQTNPDDAVSNSVQSLEIFLKEIAKINSISFDSRYGVSQLAQTLRGQNIIDPKHVNICNALGSMRNMADHGNIPDWVISQDTGIVSIILTMSTIQSIFEFVLNNKCIF